MNFPFPKLFRPKILLLFVAVFIGVIVLLGLFLNGPGFRMIVAKSIGGFAEKQGLVAEYDLQGSAFKGLEISGLKIDPPNAEIDAIEVGHLDLKYNLVELIRRPAQLKWLRRVQLKDVDLNVNLDANELSLQGGSGQVKLVLPDFNAAWNLLQAEVELENVNVDLQKQGASVLTISGLNAQINADDRLGMLEVAELSVADLPTIRDLSAPLKFGSDSLETVIDLHEWGIVFKPLYLKKAGDVVELSGQCIAGDAKVEFLASSETLQLTLIDGAMQAASIPLMSVVAPDIDLVINQLDLNLLDDLLNGQCELADFRYQDNIEIGTAKATFDQVRFDFDQQQFVDGQLLVEAKQLSVFDVVMDRMIASSRTAAASEIDISCEGFSEDKRLMEVKCRLNQDAFSYQAEGTFAGALGQVAKNAKLHGLVDVTWQGEGRLRESDHKGLGRVGLEQFKLNGSREIEGDFQVNYTNGSIQLHNIDLKNENDLVRLTGGAEYNERSLELKSVALVRDGIDKLTVNGVVDLNQQLEKSKADLKMVADQLDPNDLAGFFRHELPVEGRVDGRLSAQGAFDDLVAKANFIFTPQLAEQADAKVKLTANFSGDVVTPNTWLIDAEGIVSGLVYGETVFEDLSAIINKGSDHPLTATLSMDQSGAMVRGEIGADLSKAASFEDLQTIPLQAQFSAIVPEVQVLRKAFPLKVWRDFPLTGDVSASLDQLEFKSGDLVAGNAVVSAKALAIDGQVFQKFNFTSRVDAPNQLQSEIDIALDSLATASGDIRYQIKQKSYQGECDFKADLVNSSKLQKLLSKRVAAEILPESTKVNWVGRGDLVANQFQNNIVIDLNSLRLAAEAEPINIRLLGNMTDQSADFPKLSITGKDLSITGGLHWGNGSLQLKQLQGVYGGQSFLKASAKAPFNPKEFQLGEWFEIDRQTLDARVEIAKAPIRGLAQFFAPDLPLNGIVNSVFQINGSPAAPNLDWNIEGVELAVDDSEGKPFELGVVQMDVATKGSKVTINGSASHPEFKPLLFFGEQPFYPAAWATKQRDWRNEKILLQAKMEPSSLEVGEERFPEIKSLVGTLALDASVRGTFAKPSWDGFGKLNISRLRFRDRNAPGIRDAIGLLRFDSREILLEEFRANVAGGLLNASGRIDLSSDEPLVDIAINGQDVLVYRNHDINVRTDIDLLAKGGWSQVVISGDLGINNSYYVKNLDLLPTGLPRIRRSQVPSVEAATSGPPVSLEVGVPVAPFKDWTTDIRVYTKSPFLIRGNVGQGSATCDVKISGPLARPVPVGELVVAEGTRLTLPFSRIDVERGRVRFNEFSGFNGQLELKAVGKTDNYNVNIFLYNRLLAPKYVLTSKPSLPAEDIMTLLATGNVRDDLIGNDATKLAASKAASLFLKSLQRSSDAQNQNALINELRDRTEIDFGSFNFTNGVDSVGGRIRLWRQLFFVGNASWDDEYRALLKYIFSFS